MHVLSTVLVFLTLCVIPSDALFQSFFGCQGAGGCFFFLFGSTMHKMENGKCHQKCVFFSFLEPSYSCGSCPPSTGTSGLPGSLPPPPPPNPSPAPTPSPTKAPTPFPTKLPTRPPTKSPTRPPTKSPTGPLPTLRPTMGSATRFSCPTTPEVEVRFVLQQESAVTLERSSVDLCTLTLVKRDGVAIPVARQYEGNGWERAGGKYAGYLGEWECSSTDCSATLPAGETYVLVTRSTKVVDSQSARARFFESASFGARPSDLVDSTSFEDYVTDQIQQPATSHREFFRRRANPRWEFHAPEFGGRLDACDENTSWKRQIFRESDDRKMMSVRKVGVSPNEYWEISIDGVVRSVLEQKPRFIPLPWRQDVFEDGGQHMICFHYWDEEVRRGIYRVMTADGVHCRQVYAEDFIINFPPGYEPSQSLAATLPPLSDTSAWSKTSNLVPEYRHRQAIGSSACSGLSSYSWEGPGVYAKTSGDEWLQFVPRVNVKANTDRSPLPDGGAQSWSNGEVAACSNVPRNPFNEHGCFASANVACAPGAENSTLSSVGTLVCGSRGEISNDPTIETSWLDISSIDPDRAFTLGLPEDETSTYILKKQPEFIWSEIALGSDDQVRQRVAWALFQIFALPRSALASEHRHSEMFLNYYDIFVRGAFGNYLDILREVTYSPLMAESLSFLYSKSTQLLHWWTGNVVFPDENFARELMQLFTIGLVELNLDGTPELKDGETIRTYSSEDIMSFARAWTGFEPQVLRANIEDRYFNQIDPMQIKVEFRDLFPKSNLYGGYIGDDYPICADLPDRMYLKKGSKYLLLGSSPLPEKVEDDDEWLKAPMTKRFSLQEGSGLYRELCGSSGSSCSYPGIVVLDSDVSCPECINIDEPRVLKVGEMYYEYVSVPCVEQTFFEEGRKVSLNSKWYPPTCVNPYIAIATEACCTPGDLRPTAHRKCEFAGERMTHSTASERCAQDGKVLCDYWGMAEDLECPQSSFHWTSEACNNQKVKVASDGKAGLFQDWGNLYTDRLLRNDTVSFFPLYWEGGQYPKVSNGCGNGLCQEFQGSCLCNVTVTNTAAFTAAPANSAVIADNTHYGHADPSLYGGTFSVHVGNGYRYYCKNGNCFDQYTVFELTDHADRVRYFRNLKSTVNVGSQYSFRNPVQFHRVLSTEFNLAKAEYETDAVLQHLFYHKNTPPFVATRLIQRFGISNPSPSYVLAVATAFRTGSYSSRGRSFGSGQYGDMASTVAAVLLDREARSLVLDSDPSYGSLREPILKVLSFMRALEFKNNVPLVQLDLMDEKIGQQVYHQKSVFSYFRPEYSPPGDTSSSTLTAPEAEVMGASKIIGLLNGLFGLVKHGLVSCEEGFGIYGDCETSSGSITYSPSSSNRTEMVLDLARILTSGRMGESKQNAIVQAINREADDSLAFQLAIQLIVTSPEFHTTNRLDSLASVSTAGSNQPIGRPEEGYKAVIHLSLLGGADSFNMLVPKNCPLRDQYDTVRDTIALSDSDLLDLSGPVSGQPCSTFSVHKALPILKELYDAGDALFISNMGVLTEPVNRTNYSYKTVTQLFAHNAMVDELNELDPFASAVGTGTLGRMADVLEADRYRTGKVVVEASPNNLAGSGSTSTPIVQLDEDGISEFEGPTTAEDVIELLNSGGGSGVFGNLWSDILNTSLTSSEDLLGLLAANPPPPDFTDSSLGKRMRLTAQMIAARSERKIDRDFFYLTHGGYDAHFDVATSLNENFFDLNEALTDLVAELKQLGVWDNTVIVQTSDFGRTLTPNTGGGSDHGWGGNYFILGGGVKGKRILGQYPNDLSEDGNYNVGRGRMIPEVPWESLFQGLAEWVGVNDTVIDTVLPNRRKFNNLFSKADLFN